ncbi:unnamed protein product [Protopolystoma xenopodis]|uniref:Uncharacterized protein n=1 Tax=Protopolystoma xenopodis TaxID=117903 RepID=A0A448WRJ5_9PLAT|nr:unnamed protein product [Protopolystoma xenopodis]
MAQVTSRLAGTELLGGGGLCEPMSTWPVAERRWRLRRLVCAPRRDDLLGASRGVDDRHEPSSAGMVQLATDGVWPRLLARMPHRRADSRHNHCRPRLPGQETTTTIRNACPVDGRRGC